MRQKRIKNATIPNLLSLGIIMDRKPVNLNQEKKVFLEIGSGKGQFISSMAMDHPNDIFIGVERNKDVIYRLAQKKQELNIDNLIMIMDDAMYLLDYLGESKVDTIQLNFSDPWPKARHHKRRLTYNDKLILYKKLLKPHGKIIVRTDHRDFFLDSLDYFNQSNFSINYINLDLAPSKYMTEYEVKKRIAGPIFEFSAEMTEYESL